MPTLTKAEKAKKAEQQEEARADLREMLKPGDPVYVIQRHVSRSGMMRHLSLFIVRGGKPLDITRRAAQAMGERLYTDDGWYLKVGGAGMNMHFATVYALSHALYPEGHKCTGQRYGCPSNDHSNDYNIAQRAFHDLLAEQGEEWPSRSEEEAFAAMHQRMRDYIDHRLATDLGYRKSRIHRDGGYALKHETF